MIFAAVYLPVRCLLSCLMVLARGEASKDAELLAVTPATEVPLHQAGGEVLVAEPGGNADGHGAAPPLALGSRDRWFCSGPSG